MNNGSQPDSQTNAQSAAQTHGKSEGFSVSVLLFASLKDAAASDHIEVHLPCASGTPVSVSDFLKHCGEQYPVLAAWLPHVKVAVNCTYATAQDTVRAGDEIALLPPVAGGH